MTTTEHMGLVLPTRGDAGAGAWDDSLDALAETVDGHRHVSGEGRQIPSAGLDIDANLSFAGWVITNAGAIAFGERIAAASPTIPNQSLWVSSVNDDLYFRSAGGVDNRLTSGGALNVAIAGGIEGDYAATTASFYYDDANKRYKALQNTGPDHWATVAAGDVQLLEKASSISNAVSLKSPAALAASYTVTFPAAVPAGKRMVQASASGVLTFDNAVSGAATFDSTVQVTGLVTGAGFTSTVDTHVTVSGTGRFKHGNMELAIPIVQGCVASGTPVRSLTGDWTGVAVYDIPIVLPVGARVRTVTIHFNRGGSGTVSASFARRTGDGTGANLVTSSVASVAAGTGWTTATSAAIDHTVLTGWRYWVELQAGNAANIVSHIHVTYDFTG